MFRPGGSAVFELQLRSPRAVHPMWWTWEDVYLYRLDLTLPAGAAPMSFRLRPLPAAE